MSNPEPPRRRPATPPAPAGAAPDDKAAREARLAQALRDNLRRRKAQARARAESPAPAPTPAPAPAPEKP